MLEVMLVVRPARDWLKDFALKSDTSVKVHDCTPFRRVGMQGLIEMEAKGEAPEEIIKRLLSHPDVFRVHFLNSEGRKVILSVVAKRWDACSIILKSDCYLRDAKALPDGAVEWRIFTPGVLTLADITKRLKKVGCKIELLRKREAESASILTKRQLCVVQEALDLGYFDYPRRISARELASRLKIAPPTLSEILRSAEKKMAEFYLRKGKV